jgi:L-alanine-DL-glutamate epimerase-like enolase superfamily enzyme
MRITQVESHLLRIPLARPITPPADRRGNQLNAVSLLVAYLDTDTGHRGVGIAYTFQGGGRALKVTLDDDLAPLLVGEDPLDHERLGAKVYWRLQTIARMGLVSQAYSAVDLALWDLKGKVAGLPLYKLLGGARDAAPVYGSDIGWLWMSPDEIVAAAQPYLDQGMMGIKLKVGGDPESDAERVTRVREALGEDVWLTVDANQRYDYGTALSMGHFFEEEIGVDWFEEPISCEDVDGHARLAERLETAIALGETLYTPAEFRAYMEKDAVEILQPDLTRVGGLTACLKVAVLAEQYHRTLAPHVLPEVAVHLACGLPQVRMVEYMPWLYPALVEPPAIVDGKITPSRRPGLGLEIRTEALEKYHIDS